VYSNYLKNSKKVPITETLVYYFTTHKGIDIRYRYKNHKGPAPEAWIIHAENDLTLNKAKMEGAQNTHDRMKDKWVDRDQLAVTQIDVVALAEGQPLRVTLNALPCVGLNGTIRSIGQTYSENRGDVWCMRSPSCLVTPTLPCAGI
jgi:hypothetical protein